MFYCACIFIEAEEITDVRAAGETSVVEYSRLESRTSERGE